MTQKQIAVSFKIVVDYFPQANRIQVIQNSVTHLHTQEPKKEKGKSIHTENLCDKYIRKLLLTGDFDVTKQTRQKT